MSKHDQMSLADAVAKAIDGQWHHHWHWPTKHGRWDVYSSAFWDILINQMKQRATYFRARLDGIERLMPECLEVRKELQRLEAQEEDT